MLENVLAQARAQASHSAQSAGIGVFAGLAMAVGLAFWTGACWFFLLTLTTPLNACLIIGAVYTGAGMIGFSIVSMRSRKPQPPPTPVKRPEATMEALIGAFLSGLDAGARRRS